MDVVYVRAHPGRGLDLEPQPQQNGHRDAPQTIAAPAGLATQQYRRRWTVSITINDSHPVITTIVDPFFEAQYKTVFEHYLRDSDRQRWSPESQSLELEDTDGGKISQMESHIQAYGRELLDQLGLKKSSFSPKAIECQMYIVDGEAPTGPGLAARAGIHCLAWELLESASQPSSSLFMPRLRVTRISDLPIPAQKNAVPLRLRPSLGTAQADPSTTFRVLLVVARDFSRIGGDRDPEPDLAQWPLMSVQKKLRSRMLLEVVRPGSREELEDHLRTRASQGTYFHLVHFDLHGRIMRDEHGNQVPWLLFAKQHQVLSSAHGYHVPQTHLAKADAIAQVLASHNIENVVLNACLSAYHRSGPATSLAHIFLRHGIQNVSAMWFYVHWQTVSTYLDAFYDELLIKCKSFHLAAQKGREAIRQKPTNRTGRAYQDFFLCVNYARKDTCVDTIVRDPSPAPSARSQDSSTSNTSSKSFMSGVWKPSTPRLGDAFVMGDEPVMRMKLHLLELEYKLMTFRIVYASDLRQSDSKLSSTIEKMVTMWLNTNLVDDVFYYKAKDFARRRIMTETPPHRDRRSRATNNGYLQVLFPRPVKALRQTLHIIRDVDPVVDPGFQADANENRRREARRSAAQENLQNFARRLHADGRSYLLFLGSQDAQWWRTYLQHLEGEWWVHIPWSWTVHSRYIRDVRFPAEEKKPPLGMQ